MRSALTKERTELEKRYKEAMETAIAPIQAVIPICLIAV